MPTISFLIRKAAFACIFAQILVGQADAYVAPNTESNEELLIGIQHSIQTGDLQKARIEIRDAFEAFPNDPRLYNFLGVVDAQQDNVGAAEMDFQQAIRIAPRFVGAYMNLGRLYQTESVKRTGYYERALDVYSKVSELEPDNTEARYQAALLLNRLGRFDSSLRQLSEIPVQEQRRAAALSVRCADEAGLQHKDSAKTSAMELLRAPDLTEADVLPIIPELVKAHQADLATMLLESLAKSYSASPAVMEQLAALYEGQQRFADSRQMLTREVQITGQPSAALLMHLAKVAYKAGDLQGTLGYLAHARDLEPKNAAIHFLFGLVCIDLKLPPEAEDSLKEAVRLDPRNPYYRYVLGAVQLQKRNPDGAIRNFKIFRDAEKNDPRGSFALGVAYFDADQMEAAHRELQLAAHYAQTRAGALLYLGRLALREQKVAEATDDLERAIQANPSVARAYVELAGVQIRTKEYQGAEQNLSRALRLAPDDYQANLNLLLLYKQTNDTRVEEQSRRLAALRQATDEREQMLLRSLDIHIY